MSYQLLVEFSDGKSPSSEDVQKVLRGFDPNFASAGGNVLRSTDPNTGDPLSVDIGQANTIRLEVPYTATFRSVFAAYTLAWALADKFGGKVRDPQLGGTPSLDLARQEWRKHEPTGELAKMLGGSIPSDFATKIKQRRGFLRQEVEIRGTELEIRRKQSGRTTHYFIPILTLGPAHENTIPNPRGGLLVLLGLFIIIAAAVLGGSSTPWVGGLLVFVGLGVIVSSLVAYTKYKRRLLVFPGQGGNLLLESASPSKKEVEQFLSSVDRIRFALSRPQSRGPSGSSDDDAENMRVT